MRAARADASDELKHVLSEVRDLSSHDFDDLVGWAKKGGTEEPFSTTFEPGKTEGAILKLDGGDQHAVVSWLAGHGRQALYDQGASDYDIGPRKPGFDAPKPTPTPNAWRAIPLAAASLNGNMQGPIQVLGGFAAVKKDGTGVIACISFKNIDTKVADRVVFSFPLLGNNGPNEGLVLDRRGEFTPNIDIRAYESMAGWQTVGIGPRSLGDGCIRRDFPTAVLPLLQAQATGYTLMRVEYVDGSSWPAPPPPPAAAPPPPAAAAPPAPPAAAPAVTPAPASPASPH